MIAVLPDELLAALNSNFFPSVIAIICFSAFSWCLIASLDDQNGMAPGFVGGAVLIANLGAWLLVAFSLYNHAWKYIQDGGLATMSALVVLVSAITVGSLIGVLVGMRVKKSEVTK